MRMKEKTTVAVIGVLLLSIFTFTDLQISQLLFTKNIYGRVFEVVGELPFIFLTVFSFFLLFCFRSKKNKAVSILLGILFIVLAVLFAMMGGFMTWNYLHENVAGAPQFLAIVFALVVLIGAYLLTRLVPEGKAKQAVTFAVIGIFYFIAVIIIMNVVKGAWGRMRIREMTDPIAEFTRWYVITSRGGFDNIYASFPSGHSMNAAGTILLGLFPFFLPKLAGKERLMKTFSYSWIVLCAVSRVVMGAHFASDVTVGVMLSLVIFEVVRTIVCRINKVKLPE